MDRLFGAEHVAVVGASNDPRKASHHVIRAMQDAGYAGRIYPVHPSHREVLGLPCSRSIREIPGRVDLVVISVPTEHVFSIIEEAVARGDVRYVVILSAGFAETGIPSRVELERRIVEVAHAGGVRIVGPNCIGVINTENKLCTGFAPGLTLEPGKVGFVTQSGALGGAFLMACGNQPIPLGFSKFGHVGNMSDVHVLELLDYLGHDDATRTIGMYMEGISEGREFMRLAARVSQRKPIFLLKVGRNELGSRAALSHTGSLAGSDRIYDAALRQGGMIRVATLEELVDASKAAAALSPPAGRRVCVLTQAGGPGIIAMDEIGQDGTLVLAPLRDETRVALEEILPPMAMVCKPNGYIDMTAAALEQVHARALEIVLEDPNVDSVVFITLPPTFLPAIDVARAVAPVAARSVKPVVTCWMSGQAMNDARAHLERSGVPTFDTPDRAVRAMIDLTRAGEAMKRAADGESFDAGETCASRGAKPGPRNAPPRMMAEPDAVRVLSGAGIPYPAHGVATSRDEAVEIADCIGYPVVLKVISPDIVHKSDRGGVAVNLADRDAVATGFDSVSNRTAPARLTGMLVCRQAPAGLDVIVGGLRDRSFGPVVMFGLGGVLTEVLADTALRIAPLARPDAVEMVHQVRGYRLFQGTRGGSIYDEKAVVDVLLAVSELMCQRPDVEELDLNPVRVFEHGLLALDVRLLGRTL